MSTRRGSGALGGSELQGPTSWTGWSRSSTAGKPSAGTNRPSRAAASPAPQRHITS